MLKALARAHFELSELQIHLYIFLMPQLAKTQMISLLIFFSYFLGAA